MEKITLSQISKFLENTTIAVAGASRDSKSFGSEVVEQLKSLNYKVLIINPAFDTAVPAEQKFTTLNEIEGNNFGLLIVTLKSETEQVLQTALAKGVRHIWIQQMSETPEILAMKPEAEVNLIYGKCIFMFTQPHVVH